MANERERIAVNIPVTACARIFCSSCYVSSERDKLFARGKVVPPARATLPAEVRQLALPPPFELSRLSETSSQLHVNVEKVVVIHRGE